MIAWRKLLGLEDSGQTAKGAASLAGVVDQARRDWLYAQTYYKTVTDPDLVDYAAFLIKAYERKYIYLLKKARREGFCYPGGISLTGIVEEGTVRRGL